MHEKAEIVVIGSGVIGMTTALCLAKAGYRTTIVSKDRYPQTTSAAAAALWYPFKAEPRERVSAWAQRSLIVFGEMQNIPEAGIVWHRFSELLLPEADLPWWHNTVEDFMYDDQLVEFPVGKRKICYFSLPIIDTNLYLSYLEQSLKAIKVQFVMAELSCLDEAFKFGNTVVNCSGIGAQQLAHDQDLHPARGQVVRIKRQAHHVPVLDLGHPSKFAHITPRIHDTVLGGTYDEGTFSLEPDQNESKAIIERCKAIFPQLGDLSPADIVSIAVGLRPVRSSVRVEPEQHDKGRLFHNYGHGGSGFTLSWGCADEICNLIISNQDKS